MMRKYLLDDYVTFIPSDSSLRFSHEEEESQESFLLPVPAARLLQVLLERSPELITKEELLQIVWENYGMKGSMHNLAHYTMILRKAFTHMHMDKRVIVTVHKKGLMINPQIDVKLIGLESSDIPQATPSLLPGDLLDIPGKALPPPELTISPSDAGEALHENDDIGINESPPEEITITPPNHLPNTHPPLRNKYLLHKKWQIVTLVIITVFIMVGLATQEFWMNEDARYSEDSLRLLTKVEHCKIYTFNPQTNDSILINDVLEKTKNFSATLKTPLNCKKDRVLIYYTDAFLGPNLTGKKFHSSLTLCMESKNLDNLSSCVSHYYN